eukprot:m.300928 g.300928  ORF g.300928 m.300928 type:complete len:79 (+) comp15876_c0_seq12:196-432(+)
MLRIAARMLKCQPHVKEAAGDGKTPDIHHMHQHTLEPGHVQRRLPDQVHSIHYWERQSEYFCAEEQGVQHRCTNYQQG